jgi:hypothetical protein
MKVAAALHRTGNDPGFTKATVRVDPRVDELHQLADQVGRRGTGEDGNPPLADVTEGKPPSVAVLSYREHLAGRC